MQTRLLLPGDEQLLEQFLVRHRDSSMFLRSNAARAGLVYRSAHGEAEYLGGFRSGQLVGVAAHCWNGIVLVQAPDDAGELARACVEHTGRAVVGLSGPLEQARAARASLGLEEAPTSFNGADQFFAIDLGDVIVPQSLKDGSVECRPPRSDEAETLRDWRYAYDIELFGSPATEETRRRSTTFLDPQIADGNVWVAIADGQVVSLSAFNAALPDIVQLGGIYTPPAFRGRGYAKAVVAASLIVALSRGANRAVLFTDNPSAIRSYEAVGFRRSGDYAFMLFQSESSG